MEEPVLFQAKADYYELGCALPVYLLIAFCFFCLIAVLLLEGYRGMMLLREALHFCRIPFALLAVTALIHLITYLLRGRFYMLATPSAVILRSAPLLGTRKDTRIPFSYIRNVRVYYNTVCVDTEDRCYKLRHSADAQKFAADLRQLLMQSGVPIEKTEADKYRERLELTAKWKRRQVEKTLYPETPVQISSTTDEHGNPILPQQLTAEQAEGVFVPVAEKQEDESHAGTDMFAGRG